MKHVTKYVRYHHTLQMNMQGVKRRWLYGKVLRTFKGKGGAAPFYRIKFNEETLLGPYAGSSIVDLFIVDVEHISEEEYLTGIILNG